MIGPEGEGSIKRIYWLTGFFGLAGFVAMWARQDLKTGLAFVLGAAASAGNVFLFSYLTRAISPQAGQTKPWEGRTFITRYLLMFALGYVIVKALSVNPLAVILGLLASTAAAVTSIIIELVENLFGKAKTP